MTFKKDDEVIEFNDLYGKKFSVSPNGAEISIFPRDVRPAEYYTMRKASPYFLLVNIYEKGQLKEATGDEEITLAHEVTVFYGDKVVAVLYPRGQSDKIAPFPGVFKKREAVCSV